MDRSTKKLLITKKLIEVHGQSRNTDKRCKINKGIRFETSMLQLD